MLTHRREVAAIAFAPIAVGAEDRVVVHGEDIQINLLLETSGVILVSRRAELSGVGVVGKEVDVNQLPGTLLADSRDALPEFRKITGVGLVLERVAPNLRSVSP